MRSYEEMSKIVLRRIAAEKEPMWKYALKAILRHLLLLILMLLIVGTIGFVLTRCVPNSPYALFGEGCDQFFSTLP